MSRYVALCACLLLVACWLPTALAAPRRLHLEPRQDDTTPNNTSGDMDSSSNAVIISLSAAAAVVLLASVVILIYFPSTRRIWRPAAPEVRPQINTTTTTTVTHERLEDVDDDEESLRGSVKEDVVVLGGRRGRGGRGGSRGIASLDRASKIGIAISDVSDEDDADSSIYSMSDLDTDLEKADRSGQLTARPPSSARARHSIHISAGLSPSDSTGPSTDSSPPLPHPQRTRHYHKPISWLRLSTTSSTASTTPPVVQPVIERPQPVAVHHPSWSRATSPTTPLSNDLASRRGQPTLQHIRLPI